MYFISIILSLLILIKYKNTYLYYSLSMFKDIIKDLRESQDMSQYELAKALQVSQSAVAKWELGKTEPTSSALVSISKFFGVSADYLLELEDEFGNKK